MNAKCKRVGVCGATAALIALGGCSSARVTGQSGSHIDSDAAGLHISIGLGSTAADVVAGGALIAVLAAGSGYAPTPPMKADRTINVQDCGKPVEQPTANLRCR